MSWSAANNNASGGAVYRIIPSRFPSVGLFDDLADPDDLAILFDLEMATNSRLSDDLRNLQLVREEDWLTGPGATIVMSAFLHPSPSGSRFSDGSYGVYYAAEAPEIAIRETAYHRARFLRMTSEKPCTLEMRQYSGFLAKAMTPTKLNAAVMHPTDYSAGQALGALLRSNLAYGLRYPSVRAPGGYCVALFRPPAITRVTPSTAYVYEFDGRDIARVTPMGSSIELKQIKPGK